MALARSAVSHRNGVIEADGLRLHYVEWGEPGARPMLVLHGLGDCARSWDRLASGMGVEHRVIVPDLRGHGDSQWAPRGRYRLQDYVSDVAAVVDRLGLESIVIVGHAWGGSVAVAYAAAHPELVSALAVVDSDIGAGGLERHKRHPVLADVPQEWESLEAVNAYLRGLQPGATDEALAHQARHLTAEGDRGKRSWKRDPSSLAAQEQRDLWDDLRRLRCPTLVTRGRQSEVMTHEMAVQMREALPKVRLAELEGGEHWFHQELPGAFEATVRWFLQSPPL